MRIRCVDRSDATTVSKTLRSSGIVTSKVAPEKLSIYSGYTEIPYTVKAQGRYHEFGQLLNLLEENPDRFMRVKSLTISNNPRQPSHHPIDVGIATFMFVQR